MQKESKASQIEISEYEYGEFKYGNDVVHYHIIRKSPRYSFDIDSVRKIKIKVHPDQRVVVMVPHDATVESIHDAMMKRARWVIKNIHNFSSQHNLVLTKKYVSGEALFYLGRRYVLKVLVDVGEVANVKLNRGRVNVSLPANIDKRASRIKALIDEWYRERAKLIFNERLNAMLIKATWVKSVPSFRVMKMRKQWGSCSAEGNLMLNPHLVKAPKNCIDYVILHELCHIAEHNHGEKFWRLLSEVMPNWRETKANLDSMAELYLNE